MAYIRKTYDEWQVQGKYAGYWDILTTEETYRDAKTQLKCYNDNEPEYPHRIVKKRIRKEQEQ